MLLGSKYYLLFYMENMFIPMFYAKEPKKFIFNFSRCAFSLRSLFLFRFVFLNIIISRKGKIKLKKKKFRKTCFYFIVCSNGKFIIL